MDVTNPLLHDIRLLKKKDLCECKSQVTFRHLTRDGAEETHKREVVRDKN